MSLFDDEVSDALPIRGESVQFRRLADGSILASTRIGRDSEEWPLFDLLERETRRLGSALPKVSFKIS